MKTTFIFTILVLCIACAYTQIIYVPGNQPTIQAGINASSNGDTVLVADGVYFENIDFMGKEITVASNYILDHDSLHISNTIINGSQPVNPDQGSVVYFWSGEDTTSVLQGFTIKGGTGTIVVNNIRAGGGICIGANGAKILNNYIEYNSISSINNADGGAISQGPVNANYYLVIRNNKIQHNEAIGNAKAYGGGISTYGNVIICNNNIRYNVCKNLHLGTGWRSNGGGMAVYGPENEPRSILISDNVISYNEALSESNWDWGGFGGGVTLRSVYGYFSNNLVSYNKTSAYSYSQGAGIACDATDISLVIDNNTIAYNGFNGGELLGGGVHMLKCSAKFMYNKIYRNHATWGGGFYFWGDPPITVSSQVYNNTVVFNQVDEDGGAILSNEDNPSIVNSILWDNSTTNGAEISGNCIILYSDLNVFWPPGNGNISKDPLFFDPENDDFCITWGNYPIPDSTKSPCIDTGEPGLLFDPDGTRVDIGACYFFQQLDVPEALNAEDIGCNSFVAVWTSAYGALGYHLDVALDEEFDSMVYEGIEIIGDTNYMVEGLDNGTLYYYRVNAYNNALTSNFSNIQSVSTLPVSIYEIDFMDKISIYPNPFSCFTNIEYEISNPGNICLTIFNYSGQIIERIDLGYMMRGKQQYIWTAKDLPCGIYFVQIRSNKEFITRKIVKTR